MYTVYCNGKILHSTHLQTLRIHEDQLDLELGKTGLFAFTIYPDHPYYDLLEVMTSRISVHRENTVLFDGRVLKIEYGFHNEKRVSCEGALAFLLDSLAGPTAYYGDNEGYFRQLLQQHNAQVGADKQILPGNFSLAYVYPFEVVTEEYSRTLDEINTRIMERFGGYLQIRNEGGKMYLDALSADVDISNTSGQAITYGQNLLDIKRETDGSQVFTAILPLGDEVDGVRVTIGKVNNWKDYIEYAPAVAKYGLIHRVVTFDGITDPQVLYNTANAYIRDHFAPVDMIEIGVADLSGQNSALDSFMPGQWVQVHSKHHLAQNPSTHLVIKMTIHITDPARTKMYAGRLKPGITDSIK